jgi:ribonuclease HII
VTTTLECGVDEVGRGPLAGPVVVAAVILDENRPVAGLADSKRLTGRRREALDAEIRACAVAWAFGRAEPEEIDRINILQATLRAMERAVSGLGVTPGRVLVDGNRLPRLSVPARAVVGGDGTVPCISAASILAKVARDAEMCRMAERYPGYGFERHKGYPTVAHLQAMERLGVTEIHRRSFAPVRKNLEKV